MSQFVYSLINYQKRFMVYRKNIYIIIGILLVVFNILSHIIEFTENNATADDTAYSIGYFIGSNFFLIIGIVFLRLAYKINKKIKNHQLKEMVDKIGENQTLLS